MEYPVSNIRRTRHVRQMPSFLPTTTYLTRHLEHVAVVKKFQSAQNCFTEIGGLRQLSNEKSSFGTKLVWLTIILLATIICIFQSFEIIVHYFSDPTRVRVEDIRNNTIKLPAVTFCRYINYPSPTPFLIKKQFGNATEKDLYSWLEKGKISLSDIWSLAKWEMNISLTKYGKAEDPKTLQKLINITEIFTTVGTCYQVKFNGELKRPNKQPLFRLSGQEEDSFVTSYAQIYAPEDFPIAKYFTHIKNFVPGRVVVSITELIFRNTTKNPCTHNEIESTCLSHCFEDNFTQDASNVYCRLPFMWPFNETSPCNSTVKLKKTINDFLAAAIYFNSEQCNCKKKCRQVIYSIKELYSRSSSFEVHLPDGRITVVKEEAAYSMFDVVADLGGCLGLWLGICFLQVLEIWTFTISKLWFKLISNKNESEQNSVKRRRFRVVVIRKSGLETETIPFVNLPGFYNVTKRNSSFWVKAAWLIISVVALVLCINECIERIAHYFADPSIVNVYYTSDISVPFPTIILCPNGSDGLIHTLSSNLTQEKLGYLHNDTGISVLISKGHLTIENAWNLSGYSVYFLDKITRANKNWIASVVSTVLGNCLMFQSKISFNYRQGQSSQKLQIFPDGEERPLIVMIFPNEELNLVKYLLEVEFHIENSVDVNIHKAFSITKVFNRNLYRNPCLEREQGQRCLLDCVEKKVFQKIPNEYCRLPFMNTMVPACLTTTAMVAVLNATFNTISNFNRKDCACLKTCTEVIYTKQYHKRVITLDDNTFVHIRILNKEMMIMEEVNAYGSFALFSDLGGSLGLFSGICLMNLFEIIEYFYFKLLVFISSRFWIKAMKRIVPQVLHRQINTHENVANGRETEQRQINASSASNSILNRILWFLTSVGLLFPCLYLFQERIQYFISEPTASTTYYFRNKTITFPLMVFCNEMDHSLFGKENNGVHFLDYWNTSFFQPKEITMIVNDNEETLSSNVNSVKVATTSGLCLIITPENPLQYVGYKTEVRVGVVYFSEKPGWLAIFPIEKLPLIRYMRPEDFYTSNGSNPYMVMFELKITELIRLNTRNSPCEHGYAAASCLANCIERKINTKHTRKCRLPFMEESKHLELCETTEEYLEVKRATLAVLESFVQSDCNCPRECKAIIYSINDEEFYSQVDLLISFTIKIPENVYPVIQELAAYSFRKLLFDLGGFLGLFFGFGLIQLLEMLATTAVQLKNIRVKRG